MYIWCKHQATHHYQSRKNVDKVLHLCTKLRIVEQGAGHAREVESRLSTLATCGLGVRTSLEANRLSCPRSADTALKPYLTPRDCCIQTRHVAWP